MRQAHSTLASLFSRLEQTQGGGISFVPTAQREPADDALTAAHNIILEVLRVQEERFKVPGLEEQLQVCVQEFLDIHRKKGTEAAGAPPFAKGGS